ncbi:ribosomal protein L4 [Periconia macrospinosa]|uniref:Large ribosomal subunit protein uL4m n=1 Tax=Periconia macrospinosa TaxID=97972 RepID=A0A2V1E5W8_9PLEO|nr:ribosomal protein L4 [Periconia macrospinosa]
MASSRIAHPMRGLTYQLSKLAVRQNAVPKSLSTSFARPITTSTSSQAAVSSITTSVHDTPPQAITTSAVKPLADQTVLATIHQFPSLEPLRIQRYPANHLYLPTRKDILHRAVVFEGDSHRLGTAATKTRWEVHGSHRKLAPQKGTGRARVGDKQSPIRRGGGVAHGPQPRDFSTDLPRKIYDLAWRTALSYRFRKGELIIVDNAIEIETPSAPYLEHIFKLHERERGKGRSLLITGENRPILEQALDKMGRRRQALTWEEVDVKDLLELSRIIIERSALYNILRHHQSDLTHSKSPPFIKPAVKTDLLQIPGWKQFRKLMQTDPSERDAIRPDIYESVAHARLQEASQLPDGPAKARLQVSVFDLAAEAKDLRRAQLPKAGPLEAEYNDLEAELASMQDPTRQKKGLVALCETLVRWRDVVYQSAVLQAEAAENRRDACAHRGELERANAYQDEASDLRTDVAAVEIELFEAHAQLAEARVDVCLLNGDSAGAAEQREYAQEMQDQVARLQLEAEGLTEEGEEGEVLSEEAVVPEQNVEKEKPRN